MIKVTCFSVIVKETEWPWHPLIPADLALKWYPLLSFSDQLHVL